LLEKPSHIVIKETIVKADIIILPISGHFQYTIAGPEMSSFKINGKLNLEEPVEISHNVTIKNVLLRGSINASSNELLCMTM
jgi:hypothetical protein